MKPIRHHRECTAGWIFRTVCFYILLFLLSAAHAQEPNRWKTYSLEEGLEQPGAILQDGRGFIWTPDSRRFDGYSVKVYQQDPNDSLGFHLSSGGVKEWHVDGNGDVWIEDGETIRRYDFEKDGFVSYPAWIQVSDLIRKFGQIGFSSCLAGNKNGLWVGHEPLGLVHFNPETGETQRYTNTGKDSLATRERNSLHAIIDKGTFLICVTHDGLWKFDKARKIFIRPPLKVKDSILSTGLLAAIFPFPEHYWFRVAVPGLPGKPRHIVMVKTDSAFAIEQQFDLPLSPAELGGSNAQESSLTVDYDDIFWMSTMNKGLFRYDPGTLQSTYYTYEPDNPYSLPSNSVQHIVVDRDQNLWVSTNKGLSRLIKKRLDFYNYKIGSAPVQAVKFVKGMKEDYLMAGSGRDIWTTAVSKNAQQDLKFQRLDVKGWPNDFDGVGLFVSGPNSVWALTGNNQWGSIFKLPLDPRTSMIQGRASELKYDPPNLSGNDFGYFITAVSDEHDNLWVAKYRKGYRSKLEKVLFNNTGEVDTVLYFRHDKSNARSISRGGIWSLLLGGKDSLWAATENGLDLFHDGYFDHVFNHDAHFLSKASNGTILMGSPTDGLFEGRKIDGQYRFSKVVSMQNEQALAIEEDGLGRFWITTPRGLFLYSPHDHTAQRFSIEDGLENNFTGPSAHTPGGLIAFGTETGLVVFDPMTLYTSSTRPRPLITQLKVNNKPVVVEGHTVGDGDFVIPQSISLLSELVLDYTRNFFALEFAAMELTDPEKNYYRYKLEGFDKDWIQTDWKNRSVTYMNLSSGSYKFKVKASNHIGVWSDDETTLTIVVLPPPWRAWWAYTGYLMLVAGGLILAMRSIVQRERLKSNLKLAQVEQEKEHFELEKAKEVDRIKTSFFTNISHEFRTPLTLIKGPVQNLLEEFAENPRVRDRLKMVQRNSDLLLKLINQLLDLAKLETGTLKVEKSEGDLNSFINAVTSSFSSFAVQKNIVITTDLPSTRNQALFDKDKLETILINLINNAIKFTPHGGKISVAAKIEASPRPSPEESSPLPRRGAGGEALTLIVADTGIGIPEDQHAKIFERFHQVSEAHKEVGTGIGLSLVKELVILMGGNVQVKSKPGEGSEFKVILPLELVSAKSASEISEETQLQVQEQIPSSRVQSPPTGTEDQTKPSILVVEDNTDLRMFIIDCLGSGFHFLEAGDGKQGLDIATREVPDMIISDVMMPEMDGITMAGKVKTDIRTSHIPLILLTAKSTDESKLSGLQSGADDYLTKPFNQSELLLKVRNRIAAQAKLREKIKLELLKESPKVEVQSADEQFLIRVKEAIHERLSDEQLSVESLAEEIGLSRVQLYRKVTALTGLSVNELIRTFRLQKAAQLLQQNWGPVSQVAYEVGFSNPSYFSKVFKEEYGVLPSEYANSNG